MGAEVHEIAAYRTRPADTGAAELVANIEKGRVDMVTFTSSSTVRHFHQLLPVERREQLMRRLPTASIGPITTETAEGLGFKVTLTADEYTIPGLCDALQAFFTRDGLSQAAGGAPAPLPSDE